MKILLIGAGYVGTCLLQNWSAPEFVTVTTSPEKLYRLEEMPGVSKAILPAQIDKILESCDGVVISIAPKEGASYEETYLETAKQIKALLQKRMRRLYLLYISSTSVYGQQQRAMLNEETPPAPVSPEGKILLETEQMMLSCANETVKVCILRPGGIYGPGRELASRAKRLSGRELPGSKEQPTNHSHVEDIAGAIVFCFENRLKGIYNIVSDSHPTREELYNGLCAEMGLPPPIWDSKQPSLHGSGRPVSNAKIKAAGYQLIHPKLKL